jgi:signal transduction histidine kinase
MPARTASEERALHVLAQVVADSPFRARELIDRLCAGARDAFGYKDVLWRAPDVLVPVTDEGRPPPDEADLSVLTALGEAAAAVADRARETDQADRLKNDFVSIASHELRTPISVVHGIAATLHDRIDRLDHAQRAALLATLVRQTDRLRDLADQLLDLTRIEAGTASGAAEPFHPRARIDELLPRIASERPEEIRVLVEPDEVVVADPVAFERVAANLILNALHYGKPPVTVRAEAVDGRFGLVVEDHGPGVEPDFVPRLFDRFSRSDESRRTRTPGAGLGLAIACAYAGAMGGRLEYEQVRPHGARFTLSLPATRS